MLSFWKQSCDVVAPFNDTYILPILTYLRIRILKLSILPSYTFYNCFTLYYETKENWLFNSSMFYSDTHESYITMLMIEFLCISWLLYKALMLYHTTSLYYIVMYSCKGGFVYLLNTCTFWQDIAPSLCCNR